MPLTDLLPVSQHCVRTRAKDGVIEGYVICGNIPVQMVDLQVSPGEKAGIVLDSISMHSSDLGPIVVSLVSPGSVAACDGKLGRGDQVLEINGHSLKQTCLERARLLLDSATSSGTISLATLPFAFLKGIKQSVSGPNLLTLSPAVKHKYTHSLKHISKAHTSAFHVPHSVVKTKTDVVSQPQLPLPLTPNELPSVSSKEFEEQVPPLLPHKPALLTVAPELVKQNGTVSPQLPNMPPPTPQAMPIIEVHQTDSVKGLVVPNCRQETGLFEISLYKSMFGLGVQLVSDEMEMVAVKKIASWSPMAKDGNIRVGDHIVAVNDTIFIGKALSECESFLSRLPRGRVTFLVMAPPTDSLPVAPIYTDVARSHCGKQLITEQQVVKAQLLCHCNEPLGIEIEGGLDTPLLYVYISHLTPGSPAFESGVFRKGDQLLLIGGECVMGLTHQEALNLIRNASKIPNAVEVVAQRKESTKQTQSPTNTQTTQAQPCNKSRPLKHVNVPEVTFTVQLHRSAKEKVGLRIIGGADNPCLSEVHVKEVVRGYSAHKDGHLRRGDRIISVNGRNLAGLTRMEAMKMIREAGLDVTLVIVRKIGRRFGQIPLHPSSKAAQSRLSSHVEKTDWKFKPITAASADTCTRSPDRCDSIDVPKQKLTIDLHRGANEKFGLGIAGGADIPKLQEVHVMLLVENSVAYKDGRLKRGDRIISINQHSLTGLPHKEVIAMLQETGQDVSLVVQRNLNRLNNVQ